MSDANRATAVVMPVAAPNEPLEAIAKGTLETTKATPSRRKQEPAEISGCKGFTRFAT